MADRVGVIDKGALILVEETKALMKKLGSKSLRISLAEPMAEIHGGLSDWPLTLLGDGYELEYVFDSQAERTGISALLARLGELGIGYRDLHTRESSLEDIFVSLVHSGAKAQGSTAA